MYRLLEWNEERPACACGVPAAILRTDEPGFATFVCKACAIPFGIIADLYHLREAMAICGGDTDFRLVGFGKTDKVYGEATVYYNERVFTVPLKDAEDDPQAISRILTHGMEFILSYEVQS